MRLKTVLCLPPAAALSAVLVACGGGSTIDGGDLVDGADNATEPTIGAATEQIAAAGTAISGRVADGYIQGATVCIDLNESDSCDEDEPSAVTGEGGMYDLQIPPGGEGKPIVADIPAEAIDEDTGEPIGKPVVFIAPAEKPEFVSPITTLVHQEIKANPTLDVSDAEQSVKSMLGVDDDDVSLFDNYVEGGESRDGVEHPKAERFRYLHDTARVVTSMMKDIEQQVENAAQSEGMDVVGSVDTRRAIREIVRREVRDLLPAIAEQVAEYVTAPTAESSDSATAELSAARPAFDPDALALRLRPEGATEGVTERIEATVQRPAVTPTELQGVMQEGLYWTEFVCDDPYGGDEDYGTEVMYPSTEKSTVSDDDTVMYTMDTPDDEHCFPVYGHTQLDGAGQVLSSSMYRFDKAAGAWVAEPEEDDDRDWVLVDGQWVTEGQGGPDGDVVFGDEGTATITQETGTMELRSVTQPLGGKQVLHHLWNSEADPFWFDLADKNDFFTDGALAYNISVHETLSPYVLHYSPPFDEWSESLCAAYMNNCNVVGTGFDDQFVAVASIDDVITGAAQGIDVTARFSRLGDDLIMSFKAGEAEADGTVSSGSVTFSHRSYGIDGIDYSQTDPSIGGTYPADSDLCMPVDEEYPITDWVSNGVEEQSVESGPDVDELLSQVKDASLLADSTKAKAEQRLLQPVNPVTVQDKKLHVDFKPSAALPEKAVESSDVGSDGVVQSLESGYKPDSLHQSQYNSCAMEHEADFDAMTAAYADEASFEKKPYWVSRWRVIEAQGVRMLEFGMPAGMLDDDRKASLLIEHDGFVRLGHLGRKNYVDRVTTYNESAFVTLQLLMQMGVTED